MAHFIFNAKRSNLLKEMVWKNLIIQPESCSFIIMICFNLTGMSLLGPNSTLVQTTFLKCSTGQQQPNGKIFLRQSGPAPLISAGGTVSQEPVEADL